MAKEMNRRQFIRAVAAGTASAAALSALGPIPQALAEEKTVRTFNGKKQFAGTGVVRMVTDDVAYIGVDDRRIQLFENVYPVPRGVSYNSYLLLDEKTVLLDTVDRAALGPFFENLETALNGRDLDYIIVQHMEPDHAAGIGQVMARYPNVKLLCSHLAAALIKQFFEFDPAENGGQIIKEGDTLNTGRHTLTFVAAPMVHWPEVMLTYDVTDRTLFSADAFGTFGALNGNLFADQTNFKEEGLADARRYYTNIVGKYGKQVMAVLEKASAIKIDRICPLHGPVWREDLGWFIDKYVHWATYEPEDTEASIVLYGSVYGGTENAANILAARLSDGGRRDVKVYDVSKTHPSELIAEAFRVRHIAFACMTYNMDMFTPMKNILNDYLAHDLQNRQYSIVENGSWSPAAGKKMEEVIGRMKNMTKLGDTVTFLSAPNAETEKQIAALAETVLGAAAAAPVAGEPAAAAVKWKCKICGYIYEGETVPDDYKCPICGAGKAAFKKAE